MTAAATLHSADVRQSGPTTVVSGERIPDASILEIGDCSRSIDSEAVANRVKPARGVLLGIALGAALWVALLAVVVPHLTR